MTVVDTQPLRIDGSSADGAASASARSAPSLRDRAVRGSLWAVFGYGGGQAVRLASTLVLQRLLYPQAFGTMAVVNTIILGLHLFSDVGIAPAVVQNRRGDERPFLDTAWTIQVARGLLLWLVACALAVPAAAFFGEAALVALIPVAAATTILDGLCSTKLLSLHRHVRLGWYTAIELGTQVVASAVMITWAWLQPSLWALVGGTLAGQAFRTIASHALPGPHNRLCFDRASGRELFRFGRWIFVSTLLLFLADYCDRLLFGKLVSLAELGVYNAALMVAQVPTIAIAHVGAKVFFPSFSRALDEERDFAPAFHRSRLVLSSLGALMVAGLIAVGPAFVHALFDARFADAGWMLQLIAIGAWFSILECSTGATVLALGRVRALALGNLAKVLALAALVPLGYAIHGFPGALTGLALASGAKYGVVAATARQARLPVLRGDALLTAWIGLAATLGWCVARASAAGGPWLQLGLGTGVVVLAWTPFARRAKQQLA